MRRSFGFLAVLAGVLVLACSDPNNPPTATAPPPVPSFSANPASNGSVVYRSNEGWWVWYWEDEDRQLFAFHSNIEFVPAVCGAIPLWNAMSFHEVVSGKYPAGEELIHELKKAPEVFIYVFSGGMPTDCGALPIATGTGHLVSTASDLLRCPWTAARRGDAGPSACRTAMDRPQAVTWGAMAEGQLMGRDGQLYHYNGESRATLTGGPSGNYAEHTRIYLRPLGQ